MKTLIVEDDFTSRIFLQGLLKEYGDSHIAINGKEAVEAVKISLENIDPYQLICMDIEMPEMNGQEALIEIRKLEQKIGLEAGQGSKVIMTSSLNDSKNILTAFKEMCDGYLIKPFSKRKLNEILVNIGLISKNK